VDYQLLSLSLVDRKIEEAARKGLIVSGVFRVTPQVAEEITRERNKDNFRNESPAREREYAEIMRMGDGAWADAASSLMFDKDGLLQDGQNRMGAVAKSGTSQVFTFTFGHEPSVKFKVDVGLARNASQVITYIAGTRDADGSLSRLPSGTADAFRLFRQMTRGLSSGSLRGDALAEAWTSAQAAPFLAVYLHAAGFVEDKYKRVGTDRRVLVALYARLVAAGANPNDVEEFIVGLASGIAIPKTDARRRCSDLLNDANTSGRGGEMLALRVLFYAWNRWVRGDEVESFRPPKDGVPGSDGISVRNLDGSVAIAGAEASEGQDAADTGQPAGAPSKASAGGATEAAAGAGDGGKAPEPAPGAPRVPAAKFTSGPGASGPASEKPDAKASPGAGASRTAAKRPARPAKPAAPPDAPDAPTGPGTKRASRRTAAKADAAA